MDQLRSKIHIKENYFKKQFDLKQKLTRILRNKTYARATKIMVIVDSKIKIIERNLFNI